MNKYVFVVITFVTLGFMADSGADTMISQPFSDDGTMITNIPQIIVPPGEEELIHDDMTGQPTPLPSGFTDERERRVGQDDNAAVTSNVVEPMADRIGVALYALSRGRGVPNSALSAMVHARNYLSKTPPGLLRYTDERIGIEGETRLCAEFGTETAARRYITELRRIVGNLELLNIHVEDCDR